MTKYTRLRETRGTARETQTHVIWRGIGCLLMLIVPVISYVLASATVLVAVDKKWPMPYQLMGYPIMPRLLWNVYGLGPVLLFIQSQPNLYAVLALTVAYIVVASALISVGYAFVYKAVGPSTYSPVDAPPPKVTVKPYKR